MLGSFNSFGFRSVRRRRFDPDASTYIAAVETADGQSLEPGVKTAINDFIVGCKTDGIWDAIKASCILAGARTLNGCLVPLTSDAPTNFNFVSADYNRKTGLKGDGSTKYLDSNRLDSADPQNDMHVSVYVTDIGTLNIEMYAGVALVGLERITEIYPRGDSNNTLIFRNRKLGKDLRLSEGTAENTGLMINMRDSSAEFTGWSEGVSYSKSLLSDIPTELSYYFFGSNDGSADIRLPSDARIAFVSLGTSLDRSLFDTRVSNLITAIDGAIA